MRFVVRFALSRFMLLRWHCVWRQSSFQPLRLRQDLITAQGGMLTRITPAIIPAISRDDITVIVTPTSRVFRAGSAAWRKCVRAALPTPMRASGQA
jgi:hypothetical protein